jgi:hypothetical protein
MTITEGLTPSGRLFVYGALGLSLLIPVLYYRRRGRRAGAAEMTAP